MAREGSRARISENEFDVSYGGDCRGMFCRLCLVAGDVGERGA